MKQAFDEAGFDRAKFELLAVARNWIKSGGTRDIWIKVFEEARIAEGLPAAVGQVIRVRLDQTGVAPARHALGEEDGHSQDGREAQLQRAPSSPTERPGDRQVIVATSDHLSPVPGSRIASEANPRVPERANHHLPSRNSIAEREAIGRLPARAKDHVPPARDPSPGFIAASLAVNQAAARSVLYQVKTSDGRWWGEVRPYEIAAMQRDSIRGMALLSACGALNDKQTRMTFGELLKPERAKLAFDHAKKELDYVA